MKWNVRIEYATVQYGVVQGGLLQQGKAQAMYCSTMKDSAEYCDVMQCRTGQGMLLHSQMIHGVSFLRFSFLSHRVLVFSDVKRRFQKENNRS